jgi:hypothetical protein
MTFLLVAVLFLQAQSLEAVQMSSCGALQQEGRRENGRGGFTPTFTRLEGAELSLFEGLCCDVKRRVATLKTSRAGLFDFKNLAGGEYWLQLKTKAGEVYKQKVKLLPKDKNKSCSTQGLSLSDGRLGWWVEIKL